MAEVLENDIVQVFPRPIGQYELELSNKTKEAIEKFTDRDFYCRNNLDCQGFKERGYDYFDEQFNVLFTSHNILVLNEFSDVSEAIINCAKHYLKYGLEQDTPDDMDMGICDSWMVRVQGGMNQDFRHHNHAFSMLTGVLFLNDSQNGFNLEDPDYKPLGTNVFNWNQTANARQTYFECKRGRLLIFPSSQCHSLHSGTDENDERFSIAFNLWPKGLVNDDTTSTLAVGDVHYKNRDLI